MNSSIFPLVISVVLAHFLALLSPGPDFMLSVIKGIGGLFLLYIALSALRAPMDKYVATEEIHTSQGRENTFLREFMTGFFSGITNPKNLVFYLSLYSMILTETSGSGLKIGLGIWMTFLVLYWDSMILLVLSQPSIRRVFSGIVYYIDKADGTITGLLGIKLIFFSGERKRNMRFGSRISEGPNYFQST